MQNQQTQGKEKYENPVVRETMQPNINNLFIRMPYFGNKHQIETTAFLFCLERSYRKMRHNEKNGQKPIIVLRQITINTQVDTFSLAVFAAHLVSYHPNR